MQVRTSILISEDVLVETRVLAARDRLTASALIENLLREKIAATGVSIEPRQKQRKGPAPMSEEEKHRRAMQRQAIMSEDEKQRRAMVSEQDKHSRAIARRLEQAGAAAELNGKAILEGLAQAQKGQSKPIEEIRERLKDSGQ